MYEDGTPIVAPRVRVQFLPQIPPVNAKEHPHPGSAELQPDGTFANVTTWKYADGVIAGPQKVMVQALDTRSQPTGALDPIYGSAKTPLTLEVKPDMGPIELKLPKPAAWQAEADGSIANRLRRRSGSILAVALGDANRIDRARFHQAADERGNGYRHQHRYHGIVEMLRHFEY